MRSIETIEAELRLQCRAWRVAREFGCSPSTAQIDALLDERSATMVLSAAVAREGNTCSRSFSRSSENGAG